MVDSFTHAGVYSRNHISLKNRLGNIQRLTALVVDIDLIAGKHGSGEIQRQIGRNTVQQKPLPVIPERIVIIERMGHIVSDAVEMQPHRIVFNHAIVDIDPRLAVSQQAGLPAGDAAKRGSISTIA